MRQKQSGIPIFATFFGFVHSISGMGNEKGIRCNTGAVPAAVSPLKVSDSNATVPVNGMGRFRKPDKPEDLPKIHYNFFAFGNNSKSELQFIVSHFLPILQEAGKLT